MKLKPGLPPIVDDVDGKSFTPIEFIKDKDTGEVSLFWFDAAAADRVVYFFNTFVHHTTGTGFAGTRFELSPWQRTDVRHVFGWKKPDGFRRFQIWFEYVARKNGKTTKASGLGLYLECADHELGAQVYVVANDKDQALLTFDVSRGMVSYSLELRKQLRPLKTAIMHDRSGSVYRPLSSEASNKDGLNPHGAIIDELHEHKNRRLWDLVLTAIGAREQPVVLVTTTAAEDGESICNEVYDHAKRVLEGESADLSFYASVHEADKDDPIDDPETWKKANPNMGISVREEYLKTQARRAKEIPAFENTFRRYHLNQRTEQATRWIPLETWRRYAGRIRTDEELAGRECYIGVDVSSTTDLTCVVCVFPRQREDEDPQLDTELAEFVRELVDDQDDDLGLGELIADGRVFDVRCRFWVPTDSVEKRGRLDKAPYPTWARQGWIKPTVGAAISPRSVRNEVIECGKMFDVREVAIDPYNAGEMIQNLEEDGFEVMQFRQGVISMNMPTKGLLRAVLGGQVFHGDHPVLNWNARNLAVETREGGLVKPSKEKSTERIDGMVSLIMALGRAMLRRKDPRSVYEDRGLIGYDPSDEHDPG